MQRHRHLRVRALEGHHQRGENVRPGNAAPPDGEVALQAALVLVDRLVGLVPQGQDASGVAVQQLSGAGGRDRPACPIEGAKPQLRFQGLDVAADRRLSEEDRLGLPGKAPELHDLAEDLDRAEVHQAGTPFLPGEKTWTVTPWSRRPDSIRCTVMELPRTDGKSWGVTRVRIMGSPSS